MPIDPQINNITSTNRSNYLFIYDIYPEINIIVQNICGLFNLEDYIQFQLTIWKDVRFIEKMSVILIMNTTGHLFKAEQENFIEFFEKYAFIYGKKFAVVCRSQNQYTDCYTMALISTKRNWKTIFKPFANPVEAKNWILT